MRSRGADAGAGQLLGTAPGRGRAPRLRAAVAARVCRGVAALALLLAAAGCGGAGRGPETRVVVPEGAPFSTIRDSLAAHHIVRFPPLFGLYARLSGAASRVEAGTYAFRRDTGWKQVLDDLVNGRRLTDRLVVPEAWTTARLAPRLASISGVPADSVLKILRDTTSARRYAVPGPTLEGYLYPATYTWPVGMPLDAMIGRMVHAFHRAWTPARQAAADSAGMSERDVVTLASIVESEAKHPGEMPIISAVYHNRLRLGYPLQADPTVQYALGGHRDRLLYAAIDSAAKNPYNTYTHKGLPPGPIASPSARALDAALHPAAADFLYFVALPDGSHVFTRSLRQHEIAKAAARKAWRAAADSGR